MLGFLRKAFNLQGNSDPRGVVGGSSDSWTPPKSYPWDWWQRDMGHDPSSVEYNTTVEACVSTISQTVAMLPIRHVRRREDGGKIELRNSAAFRVLRRPNSFQTRSEFFVDLIRQLLLTGNGYGVATRNNRYEIDAIYPQYRMSPYITYDNKEVYYSPTSNELIDLDTMIPSRNVLHLKMFTRGHPLIGCTPLEAAVLSGATGTSIQGHTNRFFANMSRPSGTLQTDLVLSPAQTKELRERFEEISSDLNTGGTPILTAGLKYNPITMSATDSEIIATYRLTKEDIASIFRVPLALIGDMEKATFGNTESLMRFWVASGLGFIVEHLENTLDRLFDLPANESIEFDTDFLLQADFKGRMEGYKVGVTGGFITPNEIRLREGFKPLEGGNTLYMQMQNVPIDLTGKKLEADIEAVEVGTECARDCGGTGDPEPVPNESDQAKAIAISKSFESDLSFLEKLKINEIR